MRGEFGLLVLIANPRAGSGRWKRRSRRWSASCGKRHGYRIVRTTHPGHATEAARRRCRNGERYLVAAAATGPSTRWSTG